MRRTSFQFLSLPLLVAALAATQVGCQIRYRRDVEAPGTAAKYTYSAGGFIRYDGYDDVAGDLEIAVRDYVKPGSPVRVRLVGVIHIGDLEYYRTLQRETLDAADVVLFEGVKFQGEEAPPDLGGLYGAIGSFLGLGFQKDGIDYDAENFVHCDVTVKPGDALFQPVDPEMARQAGQMLQPLMMAKSALSMVAGGPRKTEDALKHGMVTIMAMQLEGFDEREAAERTAERLGGKGQDEELRRQTQEALEKLRKALPEGSIPGLSPQMKAEILDRRNEYVLERLRERIEQAEKHGEERTIAVFYGAAHMPGMDKGILSWRYAAAETAWFKAWRMNGAGMPIVAARHRGEGITSPAPAPGAAEKEGARVPRARREPALY